MTGPGVSGRLQAMMDMHSAEGGQAFGVCQGGQKVQQDGGIKATGECDVPGGGIAPGGQGSQESGG